MEAFNKLNIGAIQGLNLYLSTSLDIELESQKYGGVVCRLTYILQCTETQLCQNRAPTMDASSYLNTVPIENEEEEDWDDTWDVDVSPLDCDPHQKALQNPCVSSYASKSQSKQRKKQKEECVQNVAAINLNKDYQLPYKQIPTTPRKIFVDNISFSTSQRRLWDFFAQFGPVTYFQLLKDYKRRSKGRGFVMFSDPDTANKVLNLPSEALTLDNRELRVEPAWWKQYEGGPPAIELQKKVTNIADGSNLERNPQSSTSVQYAVSADGINKLDDDVMLHIFLFLPVKTRFTCEKVCKRWQSLALHTWQQMESFSLTNLIQGFGGLTEAKFQRLMNRGCPKLKTIDLSAAPRFLTDSSIEFMAGNCPELRNVNICGMRVTEKGLRSLGQKCILLQNVFLKDCQDFGEKGVWWLFNNCRDLREVSLENNKRVTGQCFHRISSLLVTLNLSGCTLIQDVCLKKLSERCPNLSELNLDDCVSLTDSGLFLLSRCHNLKQLHLMGPFNNTTTEGLYAVSELQSLEELHLALNPGVSDEFLRRLGQNCFKLRELDISGCHTEITDEGLLGLVACRNLRTLNISYLNKIKEGFLPVVGTCPLENLIIRGCEQLTNDSIAQVVLLGFDIASIDVSGCMQLNNIFLSDCIDIMKGISKQITIYIGGTKINQNECSLQIPSSLLLVEEDLCRYDLIADQAIHYTFYESDTDSDEFEEFYDLRDGNLKLGAAGAVDYLDADDPFLENELELS